MTAVAIVIGIIFLLYVLTWSKRDDFINRQENLVPALYEASKSTLNKVLKQIRLNNDVLVQYKEWTLEMTKEICEGRRSTSSLVSAFEERYPEALQGETFNNLMAIINAGLNEFATAQKECYGEAYRFKSSRKSVWGAITCTLWGLFGTIPSEEYRLMEPKYLVSLTTNEVKDAFNDETFPSIDIMK